MTQGVQKQVVILPAIESERHLIQVGRQMLRADFVPASCDAAFQERERRFDSVGVNVRSAPDVFFLPVVHFLMTVAEFTDSLSVGRQFVGNDYIHVLGDVFLDVLLQRSNLGVLGVEEAQIAVALADADYDFLVCTLLAAPIFPRAVQSSTDVGFVHLNRSIEHRLVSFFHGRTDAMAEIPRSFVADTERALNLAGRHSLFRFAEQERGEEPLVKRQVGVIENRSGGHSKLVVAFLAVVERLFGFQLDSGHLAARALRASGPAQTGEQLAALFICWEQGVYIN